MNQNTVLSKEVIIAVGQGIELLEDGYSAKYCKFHSKQDHSSYKRASRRRISLYTVMRLIIEARRVTRQTPLLVQDLKLMALEFIPNRGRDLKAVKQAKILLSNFFDGGRKSDEQEEKMREAIVHCFIQLILERETVAGKFDSAE